MGLGALHTTGADPYRARPDGEPGHRWHPLDLVCRCPDWPGDIVAYERDLATERQAAAQRDLEQAHDHIRHLLALRTAHVKGTTHDLSHGIATFHVMTEPLLEALDARGMAPDELNKHRARVRAGITLYKAMVQDLHDAALLEQDTLKLQITVVDMQQECRLTVSIPETPVWAEVDEPRIERVVMNLLLNALNAIGHDEPLSNADRAAIDRALSEPGITLSAAELAALLAAGGDDEVRDLIAAGLVAEAIGVAKFNAFEHYRT